jgi:predicted permease
MTELFALFLNVLAPVFIIVGIGYGITKPLKLNSQTLSRLAYYVFTPAFVFHLLSTAKIEAELALRMIGFITVAFAGTMLMAFLAARLLRRSRPMTAAYMMIAVFGNVGNYGLPMSQFAEGREALLPATVYFLANMVFAFVVCVLLANLGRGSAARSALQVAKTPALIAVVPALAFNLLNLQLPPFLDRATELLSNGLVPIMLLALGAQFANAGISRIDADMMIAAGIRLVGGAVMGFALVGLFGLTGIERSVGLLQASMPAAVLVSIIALENDVLPNFVTPAVLFSNLASIVTLSAVLVLM